MNLRERLLFSMTNSDLEGWNALKELISRAICTTDGCEIWASKILDADYPSAKLCGEGLRYFDSGLLKEKPVRKKKTKVSLSGDDDLSPLERFHQSPLSVVKGVGPKIEESLKAAGIATLGDLMAFYPRDYLDLRTPIPVAQLADGEFSLIHVTLTKVMAARGRCFAEATDGSGTVRLSWFHAWPGIAAVIKKGAAFWFWGRPTLRGKEFTLSHPGFSLERPREIQVIYSKIQGVGEKTFTNIMENALALLPEEYADPLPRSIIERHEFPSWHKARKLAHRPHSELCGEDLELLLQRKHSAFIRIAYEELFFLQLALSMRQNQSRATGACRILREHHRDILSVFPFPLTAGQQQAVEEMLTDMESGIPMNRLLQGDVGSGKTAVAFILAAHIMLTGRQVACMAPTTILAQQQFITMSQWAKKLGMKSALLTSELTSGERESLLAMLESGHINLLVGTHALIQDRVRFDDLGLVIIDEQHRFGVAQRARLREKGDLPHLVVMTATPIPRTLALTAYGDLDQSIIHGMPPGRTPPFTSICSKQPEKKKVISRLDTFLSQGEKGFVVVPLIDKSEETGRTDLETVLEYLHENMKEARIAALHGRMDSTRKDEIIQDFRLGKTNLLVTTTVIEVGMDIPDASNMIIMEADRFGLAQLHQLRGRVGRRADLTARCTLFTSRRPSPEGKERLELLANNHDGFMLAEEDLRMRGPGEMIGTRQSGDLGLKSGSMLLGRALLAWLLKARADARTILDEDPGLSRPEHEPAKKIAMAINQDLLIGEAAG